MLRLLQVLLLMVLVGLYSDRGYLMDRYMLLLRGGRVGLRRNHINRVRLLLLLLRRRVGRGKIQRWRVRLLGLDRHL